MTYHLYNASSIRDPPSTLSLPFSLGLQPIFLCWIWSPFLKKKLGGGGDYQQGKIIQRSSNIHKINTLTFSDSLHVLLDVIRRFWSKKMNKKRLRRNELIKIKDVVNVSLDLLQTIVISLLQMRPNRIYKEEKRGINIANMKNIITHEKNKWKTHQARECPNYEATWEHHLNFHLGWFPNHH